MADANCQEAALWAEVANAQVREIAFNNLCADEQARRSAVLAEHGIAAAGLWNIAALQANSLMFLLHQRCNEAAQEMLSWQEVSDSLARECEEQRHRTNVHERVLEDEMRLKQQLMEQELQAKMNVDDVHAALKDDVRDLQARKLVLERGHAEMQQEMTAMQTSLQAHKISSLDEKQQLEQQLQALRHQINVERANLHDAKEATAAATAATSAAVVANQASKSASPPSAHNDDAAHLQHARSMPTMLSPGSDAASYGATPKRQGSTLASGLAALQNVREQLREMRETSVSASPQRAHSAAHIGAADAGSPYSAAAADSHEMRHANSYAYMPTSPEMARAADGGHGTVASPWKARLLKLQGELKSLRTELGTSSPE